MIITGYPKQTIFTAKAPTMVGAFAFTDTPD